MDRIMKNEGMLRALTSLQPEEFEQLVFAFEKEWAKQNKRRTFEGGERQRAPGAGNKGRLESIQHKLLFILMYFKLYPIQHAMAFIWRFSQPQVNEWIHRLTPVLRATLGQELKLPQRRPAKLAEVLSQCPGLEFIIDGTERRRRRPGDKDRQKKHYSGKKKTHTDKNVIITANRRVLYLSETVAGSTHDMRAAETIKDCRFPEDCVLLQDSGFQGFCPPGARVLMPKKKPRGRELSADRKLVNHAISRLRVGVEHVIAGVKRCHIVSDTFRNMKEGFEDAVMEVACGLHNLRIDSRMPAA